MSNPAKDLSWSTSGTIKASVAAVLHPREVGDAAVLAPRREKARELLEQWRRGEITRDEWYAATLQIVKLNERAKNEGRLHKEERDAQPMTPRQQFERVLILDARDIEADYRAAELVQAFDKKAAKIKIDDINSLHTHIGNLLKLKTD
jgi:hypothetical protein